MYKEDPVTKYFFDGKRNYIKMIENEEKIINGYL